MRKPYIDPFKGHLGSDIYFIFLMKLNSIEDIKRPNSNNIGLLAKENLHINTLNNRINDISKYECLPGANITIPTGKNK